MWFEEPKSFLFFFFNCLGGSWKEHCCVLVLLPNAHRGRGGGSASESQELNPGFTHAWKDPSYWSHCCCVPGSPVASTEPGIRYRHSAVAAPRATCSSTLGSSCSAFSLVCPLLGVAEEEREASRSGCSTRCSFSEGRVF